MIRGLFNAFVGLLTLKQSLSFATPIAPKDYMFDALHVVEVLVFDLSHSHQSRCKNLCCMYL
jgi:hypothetical protein